MEDLVEKYIGEKFKAAKQSDICPVCKGEGFEVKYTGRGKEKDVFKCKECGGSGVKQKKRK